MDFSRHEEPRPVRRKDSEINGRELETHKIYILNKVMTFTAIFHFLFVLLSLYLFSETRFLFSTALSQNLKKLQKEIH